MEQELNGNLKVFELMGLQYFSLKSLRFANADDRPSCFRILWMLLLLSLLLFLMLGYIISETSEMNEKLTAKNLMTFSIRHALNIGIILVMFSSIIQSFWFTKSAKKIFLNMKIISDLAQQEFGIQTNFKTVKIEMRKRFGALLFYFILTHGTLISLHHRKAQFQLMFGAFPMIFLLTVVCKFVFYVSTINHHLIFLKKILENIFKNQPDQVKHDLASVRPIKLYQNSLKELQTVRKIYNLIYENGTLVNDSNGFAILVMLCSFVIALTISGYEIFVIIVGGLPYNRIPRK